MRGRRSAAEQQIAGLLATARNSLDLSVAFLSRLDGTTQRVQVVETSGPALVTEGLEVRRDATLCQAVLDGRLPAVVPDLTRFPAAMALQPARTLSIRSFVSAPVTLSDGTLYGTFCAFGLRSDATLGERDAALVRVLASAAAVIVEPEVRSSERRTAIEGRLGPVVAGDGGPVVLLQPIVDLASGARVGAEALSRFPACWGRSPDVVFAEAHSIGMGAALELRAVARAAEHLDRVGGHLSVNVSPATAMTAECTRLLGRLPLDRIVLELTEHEAVEDYGALAAALAPLRAAGLRLAVDDVGAGFSSLRHIVLAAPDIIKIDRSVVTGLAGDRVLSTLVRSLVTFAHDSGVLVVAEGVETAQDAAALHALGVDHGQGWYFGRPGPPEALARPTSAVPAGVPPRAALDR